MPRFRVLFLTLGALMGLFASGSTAWPTSPPARLGTPGVAPPGTPVASPVVGCEGIALYLDAVAEALAPVRMDLGGWSAYEGEGGTGPVERTADDWRELSDRLRAAHDAWTAIVPPGWVAGWHAAVGEYLRLSADAGLAAATRGVYATAVYRGPLADAQAEMAAELAGAQAVCPMFADPLASDATPVAA